MSVVTITREGRIAIVTVDNPPVNALSQAVRQGLWDAAEALDGDDGIDAVVLTCAGRTFIAGADVREFGKPPEPPHLPDLVSRLEAAAKPWVAAIHGSALGGGLEVALGCRFRLASSGSNLGLPEVNLGIIPGASGTVRTPRLVGVDAAIALVTSGKPVKAEKALEMGLIDAIIPGDLTKGAVAFAEAALAHDLPAPISARDSETREDNFWRDQTAAVMKAAKGNNAPVRALQSIRKSTEVGFDEAMGFERETFLDLRNSDQAAALRAVFFAERAAPRPAHLGDAKGKAIASAGVIGGGTMGAGIAAALRDAGIAVTLIERDDEALQRGVQNIRAIYDASVKRGRLTEARAAERMAGVTASTDYAALGDVDLVIEAVFEEIGVKRAVFDQLAASTRPDAILATNTSYLDPQDIAQGLPNPGRFIGLHFFSPANVMKLLEIVPVPETSPETLATAFGLAKSLGKIPVEAGICEGFIGNRILKRYRAAAEDLVRKGVAIAEIDAAMRAFGFAMGPFEAQDMGGLDIAYLQREGARALGQNVPETLGDVLVKAGRKGQKTGGGWYDYAAGDRKPQPSAEAARLLGDRINPAADMTREEIAEALVGEMAAEGDAILAEGIARQPSDIDLVEIHGYGFPRWRGGPMHYRARRNG